MSQLARTVVGIVCVLTALAGPHVRAADPSAVLNLAPADAPIVVVVPSLTTLNQKVQMVANAVGVPVPEEADLLAQLKAVTRMDKGLDENGAFALVVTDPTFAADAQGRPPVVLLVPVTDYAAFLGNFGATGEPNQVTELAMPNGQTGYARQLGNHAVVGPDLAKVQAYAAGNAAQAMFQKVGAMGQTSMNQTDLFVYADVQAMAPWLSAQIDMGAQQMQAEMGRDPQAAAALPIMQMYFDAARAIVRDSTAAVLGLGADELGVGLTSSFQFKPESELAKMFGPGEAAKHQLNRLPDQPYLVASAVDLRGLPVHAIVSGFVTAMEAVPEMAGVVGLIKPSLATLEHAKGMAQVISVPEQMNMMGGGLFTGVSVIDTDNPAAMLAAYRQSIEGINGKGIPLGPMPGADPNAPAPQMTYTTSYTPNALQIDGLSVDQYSMQMNLPPELMQANPMMPMMMMGMGATTGYVAAADQFVVVTTTPDAALVRNVLSAAKGASPGLGGNMIVEQVRQQLTPEPVVESYLSVSSVLNMVNTFGVMFGMPAVQVPADLPPVGTSLSSKDASLAGRVYVPMAVIKAGADLSRQFQGMMNQGGPGAGGSRQGPPPAPF